MSCRFLMQLFFADTAVALMDSGRCPARPPLLIQAFSGAFCGGGGNTTFY